MLKEIKVFIGYNFLKCVYIKEINAQVTKETTINVKVNSETKEILLANTLVLARKKKIKFSIQPL